jgi:threonylcarbamoyladenosine tRNA methylthiotransferase CDKAL1
MEKVLLITTGTCSPSRADFYLIKAYLKNNGWKLLKRARNAGVIIIYTCAFTKEKEDMSVELIKKAQKEKKSSAKIIVTGCLPAINKSRLMRIFKGDMVHASCLQELDRILNPKLSIGKINYIGQSHELKNNPDAEYRLRIGWGCRGKCSYCATKFVFGKPRSRPPLEIIQEFEIAYNKGYRRFILVANDNGDYGEDLNISLISLLGRLSAQHGECKFSLSHLSPDKLKKLSPLLKKFICSGRVWRINIPVESGSNRILRLMNRNYTVEDFKSCVQKIMIYNQDLEINTDILLGFPSETDQDFQDSLRLVEWLGRQRVYFQCLSYSKRPNTEASRMSGQISQKTKDARLKQLRRLCGVSYILRDKNLFKKLRCKKHSK